MVEGTGRQEPTVEAVLAVFDGAGGEPLTSVEVAEAVGCTRRTAYNRLETLEAEDALRTKKVGSRGRVWWRDESVATASMPHTRATEFEDPASRVVEIELRSARLAEAFSGLPAGTDSLEFDVEHDLPLPDGRRLQYYTVEGIPPRPFADVFAGIPSMESVRLLSTVGDVSRLEGIVASESVSEIIRHHGGQTKSAGVHDGEHWVVAELPATADTDAVVGEIRELYPDMRLASTTYVPTVRDFWTVVEEDLSERQRAVLQLAYYAGYFEEPRLGTGVELAERLGITRQTFNHHLRQAEKTVFDRLFRGASLPKSDW
ncbi:bacterio-opsin activator domain-containing protein [Halorarius litoreus]|uniref:helix-turn-helix domain-containing protein n=1 Tax=Halorarius litoreus TaxID=2962676 RepID=UPI0020CBFCAC|nr:bacterio-opsin activator domain-containing protein [Halorarius litoreus]